MNIEILFSVMVDQRTLKVNIPNALNVHTANVTKGINSIITHR